MVRVRVTLRVHVALQPPRSVLRGRVPAAQLRRAASRKLGTSSTPATASIATASIAPIAPLAPAASAVRGGCGLRGAARGAPRLGRGAPEPERSEDAPALGAPHLVTRAAAPLDGA